MSPRLSATAPKAAWTSSRSGLFGGKFAKGGLGGGEISIGQTEVGEHGARIERREIFYAHFGRFLCERGQEERNRASRDAGVEVARDDVQRRAINRVQGAFRRHAGSQGGQQRRKCRAIGRREHQQIGERPALRIEHVFAVHTGGRILQCEGEEFRKAHPCAALERLNSIRQVAADAGIPLADPQGGDDVADALGDPLGKGPAAAVNQDVRVLVGGHAQFAARHGRQNDVVAAIDADEEGVGAGPRTILAVLLG